WRGRCRRGFRATSAAPAASSLAPLKPIWRNLFSVSRPRARAATSGRPGSGRSPMHGCRSMTCTGRLPCWWRNQAARKARHGVSASPTGAFCRSQSTTPPPTATSRFTTWSWCASPKAKATRGRAPNCDSRTRGKGYWTPRNYDRGSGHTLTLRRALENSRNLATVHLLDGGIESKPEASLSRLCDLALEAQIYRECLRYYPFVLGAQPVRPIDLAGFYA